MKPMSVLPAIAVIALAACEPLPPPTGPGWGAPPPPRAINIARAERACVAQAEREGLRVRNVGRSEIITDRRGRVVGTQSILRVSHGRRSFPVRCTYAFDTRIARITPIRRA